MVKCALRTLRACNSSIKRETINYQGDLVRLKEWKDLQG
jgi:hypothetical protein